MKRFFFEKSENRQGEDLRTEKEPERDPSTFPFGDQGDRKQGEMHPAGGSLLRKGQAGGDDRQKMAG